MKSDTTSASQLNTDSPERIYLVDALRGFALMGLFLVHCLEYFELYWINPTPSIVHDVVFFLFGGKAYAIFGMLFGLSFYIIMKRQASRGVDFKARFIWRLIVLLIIGYLHSLIYSGDILQTLAILGLILVFVNWFRNRWIFIWSVIFLINFPLIYYFFAAMQNVPGANDMPVHWILSGQTFKVWSTGNFMDVVQINSAVGNTSKWYFYLESGRIFQLIGLFMWGLLLGRLDFFGHPEKYSRQRKYVLIAALISGVLLFSLQTYINHLPGDFLQKEGFAKWHLGQIIDSYLSLSITLILVLLFVCVYQYPLGQKILHWLVPAGNMSLSIYITQSIICVPLFYNYGLGWYKIINQSYSLLFGLIFFACQVLVAHWWMKRFYYGPFEWLWRAGTYLTVKIPFVRKVKE